MDVRCCCRRPHHCPQCNGVVTVPLTHLQTGPVQSNLSRRLQRNDPSLSRENLANLARGSCSCPLCGASVECVHERRCIEENLAQLGISHRERETLLIRIQFPE